MSERIAVVAGTYGEYKGFIRRHSLDEKMWFHADRREKIMGLRGIKYLLVGRYYLNPIYDEEPYLFDAYDMKKIEEPMVVMQNLKEKVSAILKAAPLSISQTRRAGSNGLRNSDEIADLIVAAVSEREAKLVAAIEYVIAKIEEQGDRGLTQVNRHGHIYEALTSALQSLGLQE